MAKKSFKKGFDSLLTDAMEGNLVVEDKSVKKSSGKTQKSFASDLDSFLKDAIEESIKSQAEDLAAKDSKKKSTTKKRKKPVFGLDALIRQTVETSEIKEVIKGEVKRVTFTFDKKKIEKLKKIARVEKSYLRDIIDDLVSQYIDTYEGSKG